MSTPRRCEIPSMTLGPCDLEWGHEGGMHSSCGDGFFARDWEKEHRERQMALGHRIPTAPEGDAP